MKVRTIQVLLFIAVLSLFAADFTVGCGQGYVYGPVTQKYRNGHDGGDFVIAVNGKPYDVPQNFWYAVSQGDWVKFTGKQWEIAKYANGQTPATSTP